MLRIRGQVRSQVRTEGVPVFGIPLLDSGQHRDPQLHRTLYHRTESPAFRLSPAEPVQNQKIRPAVQLTSQVFGRIRQRTGIQTAPGRPRPEWLRDTGRGPVREIFQMGNRTTTAAVGHLPLQTADHADAERPQPYNKLIKRRIDFSAMSVPDSSKKLGLRHETLSFKGRAFADGRHLRSA